MLWIVLAGPLLAATVTARPAESRHEQANTPQAATLSTKSGVYTEAQAARGESTYASHCMGCHTTATYTSPAFRNGWNGLTVWDLYSYISEAMPEDAPGALSATEYADIVAYFLKLNRVPTGRVDLPTTAATLNRIRIEIGSPMDEDRR